MNVFFDVDDTLIARFDGSLRPLTREVFAKLVSDGHELYVWSGIGLRYFEVNKFGLRPFVRDLFRKPLAEHRASLVRLGIGVEPHFVIDDHQEVVDVFGGHLIAPYSFPDPLDREMEVVYEKVVAYSGTFRPMP